MNITAGDHPAISKPNKQTVNSKIVVVISNNCKDDIVNYIANTLVPEIPHTQHITSKEQLSTIVLWLTKGPISITASTDHQLLMK
jgi:hypothetical protein